MLQGRKSWCSGPAHQGRELLSRRLNSGRHRTAARAPLPVAGIHPPAGCAAHPYSPATSAGVARGRKAKALHPSVTRQLPPPSTPAAGRAPSFLLPRHHATGHAAESCLWKHDHIGLDLCHRARPSRSSCRLRRHRARKVFAVQ